MGWKPFGDAKWVQKDGSRFPRTCKRCKGSGKHANFFFLPKTACRDCGNSARNAEGKTIPKTKGWVKTPRGVLVGKVRSASSSSSSSGSRRRLTGTELLAARFERQS